jgi:outer membrane protein TolC
VTHPIRKLPVRAAAVAVILLTLPAAAQQNTTSAPPASAPAPAPAVTPLGVAEVVRVAQDRFPLVLAAGAEKEGADADLLAAQGGFDPVLRSSGAVLATGQYPSQRADVVLEQPTPLWGTSVFAGYRVGLGKFAAYDGKLETNDHGELRAGLRVPVLRDGWIDRRRASIQRAEIGVEIAKLNKDQQKIEIARLAAQRYWDWAGAGRRLAVVEDWLALAESRNADLTSRVERGDLPEIEQLENERSVLARRAQAVAAKRQLEQAAIDLSLFFRKADGKPDVPSKDRLPASLPEPPAAAPASPTKDAETAALARRPEPKRADAVKAQASVELDLAKNQAFPAIDLFVAGSADLGPGDAKRGIPVLEAGVLIDIPILGRPQRGRVRAQEAAVRRADKQAELARDRVGAEVKDAASALDAARKRAEVAAQEVALAEKLEGLEKRRFDLGDSTMLVVNLREQATLEARLRRVDALVDFQKAAAAQRAAQGRADP